ncbi:PadR family transcriptional regulator [Gordonia sp. (in: high G+C Gram-positive bacteria)]|uniref:PadR family transcriptional regulator n=1 Tax=Gordonia sp. (in: high G+C Gram-positive bacteria) TaxID=84139 RepID=UPI0039E3F21C
MVEKRQHDGGLPVPGRRSPLALVLLATLVRGPLNAYQMQQTLIAQDKGSVVNVGSRNSLYQVLERLERDGLVTPLSSDSRDRPYRLTDAGWTALHTWLADTLSAPRNEYPTFPAALATASLLTPAQLAAQLERRQEWIEATLAEQERQTIAIGCGLDRIFLIEEEYRRAMLTAEHEWLRETIAELRDGTFTWQPEPYVRRPTE